MSVFVAICPGCKKKVGVPRPGSIMGVKEIKADCPFCGKIVYARDGFEVPEPPEQDGEFDLLSVE